MAKKKKVVKKKVATKKKARAASKRAAPKKSAARKKKPATKKKRKAAQPDEAAMMAAWQKAMTPGERHRRLEPIVGTWDTRVTFWMQPGAAPQEGSGVSEHRWALGGRHVEQHYKGTSMGMPFEGLGYTGFDNVQGKYVGTWMDTMSTGIMSSVGSGRPTDKQMSFDSVAHEPSGKKVNFHSILRIQDRDHHTYEMWTKGPGGRRFRTMLVEYSRR